jgi:hypothetical protein
LKTKAATPLGPTSALTNARGGPGATVQERLAKVRADLAATAAIDDASITKPSTSRIFILLCGHFVRAAGDFAASAGAALRAADQFRGG